MQVKDAQTIRYTVYATIVADEGETLTEEAIEDRFFYPFGGHIIGMTNDIAHIVYYTD